MDVNLLLGKVLIVSQQPPLTDSPMTILLVSHARDDHTSLQIIFSQSPWRLRSAFACEEALTAIRSQQFPVLICVENLPDGDWRRLVAETTQMPIAPRVLVSSRLPNDGLWAEVLQTGAYDLLPMPWERREVLRLNSLAWHSWAFACRSAKTKQCATLNPPDCVRGEDSLGRITLVMV